MYIRYCIILHITERALHIAHCTLHITRHYTTLHSIPFHYITLTHIISHTIALCRTMIASHHITLHKITSRYMTCHHITDNHITLYDITLQYLTLQSSTGSCRAAHYSYTQYAHNWTTYGTSMTKRKSPYTSRLVKTYAHIVTIFGE